jgi:PII-like signaling protein
MLYMVDLLRSKISRAKGNTVSFVFVKRLFDGGMEGATAARKEGGGGKRVERRRGGGGKKEEKKKEE